MERPEKQLIADLKKAGFNFRDIDHLFRQKRHLPITAVNIILKWLPDVYNKHLGSGDCLVRSLIAKTDQYDPGILIDLFENSNYNESIKWTIAYVLSITNTTPIGDWLLSQLLDKEHSFARAGLLAGIVLKGNFSSSDELRSFLLKIFDKYCRYETFQKLIQKYAALEDVQIIEEKAAQIADKSTQKALQKVVDKIRARKRLSKYP
jgi:hypothetical protein